MRRTLGIGTLALVLALFGCGGGDDSEDDEGSDTGNLDAYTECLDGPNPEGCELSDEAADELVDAVECVESDGEDC